ncbi:MAG TPA: YfiR family protein, partial [Thermoanaerobaculia bacterium]|nr:YfiR family protein [Thermoanaerobaculia bacterium]
MALLRRTAILALLLALAQLSRPARAQEAYREYDVKAAFLYNFVKFVEWPAGAFRDDRSPIEICVYGTDPFGDSLDGVVKGETVEGRGLAIRRPAQLAGGAGFEGCHVLFISGSERESARELLAALGSRPVLTVGDTEGFLRAGGMINFVLDDGRV